MDPAAHLAHALDLLDERLTRDIAEADAKLGETYPDWVSDLRRQHTEAALELEVIRGLLAGEPVDVSERARLVAAPGGLREAMGSNLGLVRGNHDVLLRLQRRAQAGEPLSDGALISAIDRAISLLTAIEHEVIAALSEFSERDEQ